MFDKLSFLQQRYDELAKDISSKGRKPIITTLGGVNERKKAYELRNIVYLFEAYKHYANNDLDKVSDSINQIDVDRISIPCSKKSIE